MSILSDDSLEFARRHISKYYDSDFFPKPQEFGALWYYWEEVKVELRSRHISKMLITPPHSLTIAKPRGGFRVVHQLEPLDAIIYTALAYEIATFVESSRMPIHEHVACSYRIALYDGSFFSNGSGWMDFGKRTEVLAKDFQYVLVTDITNFYNQIYLHRLNNAIETCDSKLKSLADDLENFLSTLNSKASLGVPVGPAASIIMAEAVLIDVDRFIQDQGIPHTRYVDDIRIFSNSIRQLNDVLQKLTLYLYENHRLTLSSEKTRTMESEDFVKEHLHNSYVEEKIQILEKLEILNPYTNQMEEISVEVEDETVLREAQIVAAIEKVVQYEVLDLGLARGIIRAARRLKSPALIQYIFSHFDLFSPAINDVVLYLNEVTNINTIDNLVPGIEAAFQTLSIDNKLVRIWMEWYISQHDILLKAETLYALVRNGSNIETQALAAITTRNVAWVRSNKSRIHNLSTKARRAVLMASKILPSDERKHWLKMFAQNSNVPMDRWVANWILKTS